MNSLPIDQNRIQPVGDRKKQFRNMAVKNMVRPSEIYREKKMFFEAVVAGKEAFCGQGGYRRRSVLQTMRIPGQGFQGKRRKRI